MNRPTPGTPWTGSSASCLGTAARSASSVSRYRGWLAALAGVGAHPAIKAISPQGLVADAWLGDDFFHQGAFRQSQAVAYAAYVEGTDGLSIPDYDQYDFYRKHLDARHPGQGDRDRPPPVVGRLSHAPQLRRVLGGPRAPERGPEGGGSDPRRRRLVG